MADNAKATQKKRVAVLISGRGSNMSALIKAAENPAYPAEIALVISNKPSAAGLKVAEEAGIETAVIRGKDYDGREAFDSAINACLRANNIEIVCLAGFMRILTPGFVASWQGRMINIHPSLLPSFKGLDTHERAIQAGVKLHGCTVHFVTEEMDDGPIIIQAAVPVLDNDTPESLGARVLQKEHEIYPQALSWVAQGLVRVSAGRTFCSTAINGNINTITAPQIA